MKKYCKWKYDDYYDYYDTECGETFTTTDGQLKKEDKIKFCPFCGKEIWLLKEKTK